MTFLSSVLHRVASVLLVSALIVAFPAGAKLTVMHGYADYTSALL